MLQTRKIALVAGITAGVALAAFSTQMPNSRAASAKSAKVTPAQLQLANGTWSIDPMHSRVGFSVRHVLVNEVQGTFDDIDGKIVADSKDVSKSSVEFSAKVASINTRVKQRDDHLRSPDFFDAEKYPELTFKSTRIERVGKNPYNYRVTGLFTMHGVTKTISFPFTVAGPQTDGFGFVRAGIKANLQINRQDYGVKWNQTLDNGGLAVGNEVNVSLDLEAVKDGTGPKKPNS